MLFFSQSFKLMVCWGKACYHRLLGESMYETFSQYFLLQGIWYRVKYRLELCCGIIFSGKKKIKQKFWMQSNKKDRQVILLVEMVCVPSVWVNSCLVCCSSCWKQILNWWGYIEAGPSLLALGSPETTLAMELCAQNLTCSDKENQKKQRLDAWAVSPESQF